MYRLHNEIGLEDIQSTLFKIIKIFLRQRVAWFGPVGPIEWCLVVPEEQIALIFVPRALAPCSSTLLAGLDFVSEAVISTTSQTRTGLDSSHFLRRFLHVAHACDTPKFTMSRYEISR